MRQKKEELYIKEREEIMLKILKIIGISKDRKRIRKDEIEKEEVRNQIKELMEDIRRYYKISNWRSINTWKDKEINIINNVLKDNGIETIKIDKKRIGEDKKYHNYREYIYEIKDEILNQL
jgi:hypothetical protein